MYVCIYVRTYVCSKQWCDTNPVLLIKPVQLFSVSLCTTLAMDECGLGNSMSCMPRKKTKLTTY